MQWCESLATQADGVETVGLGGESSGIPAFPAGV